MIAGDPRRASAEQSISSGDNLGRTVLGKIGRARGASPSDAEAEVEANVELVETLMTHPTPDSTPASPTAIVLPLGSGPDDARWLDSLGWRPISPSTLSLLGASADDDFATLAKLADARFQDHAAAGVAYHF